MKTHLTINGISYDIINKSTNYGRGFYIINYNGENINVHEKVKYAIENDYNYFKLNGKEYKFYINYFEVITQRNDKQLVGIYFDNGNRTILSFNYLHEKQKRITEIKRILE